MRNAIKFYGPTPPTALYYFYQLLNFHLFFKPFFSQRPPGSSHFFCSPSPTKRVQSIIWKISCFAISARIQSLALSGGCFFHFLTFPKISGHLVQQKKSYDLFNITIMRQYTKFSLQCYFFQKLFLVITFFLLGRIG